MICTIIKNANELYNESGPAKFKITEVRTSCENSRGRARAERFTSDDNYDRRQQVYCSSVASELFFRPFQKYKNQNEIFNLTYK